MSEKNGESWASSIPTDSALDALENWYHVPALGAVVAFMLWVRVQAWENFTRNGEVYFSGNDAYYHFRQVMYTVQNWPQTMPFDPWTHFPQGTSVGQFGTLFDQIVATAALIVGLGDPSQETVALTLLFAPAVFGALLAIPTYFIGKRLGGRLGGLFAAVILALLPGYCRPRSVVGAADHNGAEPLFQSLAVLATIVALSVAEREKPVYEQFLERDVEGLRRVVGYSALAGIATAAYMWMWPPGVLLVGIFGVFYLVKLTSDYYTGTSPDHVAVVAAVSMGTTGTLMFVPLSNFGFSATEFSALQPLFSFAVGLGGIFLAWLAREWDNREFTASSYLVAVFSILLVGIGVLTLVLPDLWAMLKGNLLRFLAFSAGAGTRTIGEAQPFLSRTSRFGLGPVGVIFLEYGVAFFTALLGATWILLRPHLLSGSVKRLAGAAIAVVVVGMMFVAPALPATVGGIFGLGGQMFALFVVGTTLTLVAITGDHDGEKLLIVVWAAFLTSAAFTQVRFNYYLVVPVVVLNAYVLKLVLVAVSMDKPASQLSDVSWYQVGTVLMVFLLVFVPLGAPVVADTMDNQSSRQDNEPIKLTNDQGRQVPLSSAVDVGESNGPGGVVYWDSAMEWMQTHAPDQGNYGDANNADQMDYYGTYAQRDDFDYPDGAYGVMSWWDYGHWMTVEGETIPHANPFQQGATSAANYLLAQNESRAHEVLEGIQEDDAKMRYVAVDYKMIMPPRPDLRGGQSKFSAPIVFHDGPENFTGSDFYRVAYNAQYNEEGQITNARYFRQAPLLKKQPYYESMMVRLYRYHGSAKEPQPVVVDWRETVTTARGDALVFDASTRNQKQFANMSAARAYAENDSTAQIGGYGDSPPEYVEALEHYRLVGVNEDRIAPANLIFNGELSYANMPAWVKLFERVEGAQVTGTGPANETVTATVQLRINQKAKNGSAPTFTYTQRAQTGPDGEFTMTLPYSSEGYDNWGPDNGHTNVSVRATGPYEFATEPETSEQTLETTKWNATAHVSEAAVIGESDETITVELEERVVDRPEGANNTSANETLAGPSTVTLDATESPSDATTDATWTQSTQPDTRMAFGAAAITAPALLGAAFRRIAA
jgi:oligosaccharyl transferase (archaeosortase A-associated)